MKSYIWSWPTRLFHWLFAASVAGIFLTSAQESLLVIHVALGYSVAVLLLFRIVWGVAGPIYSSFRDWPLRVSALKHFLSGFTKEAKGYAGHNPAASFVLAGVLAVSLFSVVTGLFLYGIQEGRGPLAALNALFFSDMVIFARLHELSGWLLGILVASHLAGVAIDTVLHGGKSALFSMIDGFKEGEYREVVLNPFQKRSAAIFLTLSILLPLYALQSDSFLTQSRHLPQDYEKIIPEFVDECGACHTLYPPFLLPSASWRALMEGLDEHFGDDASLYKERKERIEEFLSRGAAEFSTKEAAVYILKSIEGEKDIIAITKTDFWRQKHATLSEKIFRSAPVRRASNCKACHSLIERGLIEDDQIDIPKGLK